MKIIAIPEQEFLKLKTTVSNLQKTIQAMQTQIQALKPLLTKKNGKAAELPQSITETKSGVSWKRGSGKHLVLYMADDFAAPLEDLKEYME